MACDGRQPHHGLVQEGTHICDRMQLASLFAMERGHDRTSACTMPSGHDRFAYTQLCNALGMTCRPRGKT